MIMNQKPTRNFLTAVALIGCLGIAQTSRAQETLTLDQAKKVAIDRNAGLKAAREKANAAQARSNRAQSNFYPALESRLGSEQGVSGKPTQVSAFAYLVARWNLYRGGRDTASSKAAALDTKLAELEFESQQLSIENQVEEVFNRLLFLRDVIEIKNRFVEINSKQQGFAKQLVVRGGGSISDIVEFDLKATKLGSEIIQTEAEYQANLIRLKSLIGEDIAKNPKPIGELPHQHFEGAVADYANPALGDVPEIRAAALAVDIAGHQSNATKGRWLPQVDLEGRLGVLPESESTASSKLGNSVALVATWEIFGGFDATYQAKELQAAKSQADWQLKSDIRQLLAQVEVGVADLVAVQKRADLEKDNIRTAQKHYDLVFSDFKRGYKNSGDFSAAAQGWYEAEAERKRLDFEFIEKKLELELKIGRKITSVAMKDADTSPSTVTKP